MPTLKLDKSQADEAALALRVGMGLLFVIGGWNKLSQLLDPARHDKLVDSYTGSAGYINQFFAEWLSGAGWSASAFLTTLSTFELLSGLLLCAGLLVRPLALLYAFLLWTFVLALPVTTTPGVVPDVKTFLSPAALVQIRDIALSGMMFTLFSLGSGLYSLDEKFGFGVKTPPTQNWDSLGLLLRISIGGMLLVAALFVGGDHIPTFGTAWWILLPLGIVIVGGMGVRPAGAVIIAVMIWYMGVKLTGDKSIIGNLNGFKREIAFAAAGFVLFRLGGGGAFTWNDILGRTKSYFGLQS